MEVILLILAVVFLVLWQREKKKSSAIEDIKSEKEAADLYVQNKKAEGDSFYDEKHREALDYYWKKTKSATERVKEAEAKVTELIHQKEALNQELESLHQDVLCEMTTVDLYDGLKSDEVKNQLALLKTREDDLVRSGAALLVTNSSSSKKVVESQKKQILRSFNAESASIIDGVSVKNIDSTRTKLQRSFDSLNNIFSVDGVKITQEYLSMKFEEMSLVYAYMVKIEEEKEQKKAIREQMVEEEKVRREIEREKQKIEKEETQFSNEVKKLMTYMQKAKDDVERQLYLDKISELEEKLKALEADKENVLQREQNTRAGFVYIISNIGSFGEQVFKIGMTRRLEPMDRIAELSSASVPFPFDVHALIFSEDAPGLETILHQHFDAMRVNKVNPRKEFFKVNLDEIKKVVLENHNATVKFVDIPEALEYRETLKIEEGQSA